MPTTRFSGVMGGVSHRPHPNPPGSPTPPVDPLTVGDEDDFGVAVRTGSEVHLASPAVLGQVPAAVPVTPEVGLQQRTGSALHREAGSNTEHRGSGSNGRSLQIWCERNFRLTI